MYNFLILYLLGAGIFFAAPAPGFFGAALALAPGFFSAGYGSKKPKTPGSFVFCLIV